MILLAGKEIKRGSKEGREGVQEDKVTDKDV